MAALEIAPGLSLDADYMGGGTFALLAKKGAGKTYTGRVIAEEFWKAKVPFVALDPMDAWWGLRSSADGQGEGIPVAIFGGPHGDAPLEDTSGKLIADLVVEERLSMVLSLKHFGTRAAERRFALDFLERLYRRNSELVHLLVDEADLFAPQRPQAGDQPLLGVTENIVRRGRNNGIGITLITQRPAVLNKDVLTQADGLCVMRMLGPQDRNAIDDWVGEHGDTNLGKEVKESLPTLQTGECWWWVPEHGILQRVHVRSSRTFDSSPTRKRGAKGSEPKSFADIDLEAIQTKMAETIERAKQTDPAELKKRIRELERDLAKRPTEQVTETVEVEKIVEVPVLNGEVDTLQDAVVAMQGIALTLERAASLVNAGSGEIRNALNRWADRPAPAASPRARAVAARPAPRVAPTPRPVVDVGDVKLGKGERTVLSILAEYPDGRTHNELAFLAGYSAKASTLGVILANLRRAGLVEPGQPIRATQAGIDAAGGVRERPTGDALLQEWLRHPRMGEGERRVLLALVEHSDLTHVELCGLTGYSPSASTMGVILSKLRKLGLVEKGARRLAPEFREAIEQ